MPTRHEHENVFRAPCTLMAALHAPAQYGCRDTCQAPHFTPELTPELATMCIDAPWPLSTASSRISGNSGPLLEFSPWAWGVSSPSAHAVHITSKPYYLSMSIRCANGTKVYSVSPGYMMTTNGKVSTFFG